MVSNLLCLVSSLEDTLSALQCVTGKKDPDTSQCKKLKQAILTLSALLDLLLSQVAMTQVSFLTLKLHIIWIRYKKKSCETNDGYFLFAISHSVLLGVSVLSQVFRSKIVSHNFLTRIGLLLVSVSYGRQWTKKKKKESNRYCIIAGRLVHIQNMK